MSEAVVAEMTTELSPKAERRFARDGLPWAIGAGALAIYLASLNHWVTPSSLGLVTRANGWDWPPTLSQPLQFLLTYPFRWLPAAWVPVALNGFTAVCASLTLVLLARSVALLPQDRLEQQRLLVGNEHALLSLPDAWVPVVLAAGALGLQLTFWEHAIAASGEMLDLLLMAYCIRCLLEHRVDQRDSWLDRAALCFGVALANNWAMVGFLPLFVAALLRTKRLRFFNLRFLRRLERLNWENIAPVLRLDLRFGLRMGLLGLAGLSLLLVVPLAQLFSPDSPFSFWQALHAGRLHTEQSPPCLPHLPALPPRRGVAAGGGFAAAGAAAQYPLGGFYRLRKPRAVRPGLFILHIAHGFLLLICLYVRL